MRRELAMTIYRQTWSRWLLAKTSQEKENLEVLMDSLQGYIGENPRDPRWIEFRDTLPGFKDYFARRKQEMDDEFNLVMGKTNHDDRED